MAAGHDRHDAAAELEADAPLFEIAHHAVAAASPNALPPPSTIAWTCWTDRRRIEQIGLARAGRAAAHVNASDRALLGEDDRAPGRPLGERVVPDLEPWTAVSPRA